jgi:hypothetical protein
MLIRKDTYSLIVADFYVFVKNLCRINLILADAASGPGLEEGAPGGRSKNQLDAVYLQARSS